ncbi:MAG TPA: sigma-54-dependent Fis family transcriptional regulator [Peptococcaceae bacterium]|nr:sigma-54-dependent Fis family transcriptional regulator [Peptococcaceae bacterium]
MGMNASILIVDDEKEMGEFFRYLLESKGHKVVVTVSGAEARKAFSKEKFHLAIVDLKLPDTDGLTLLREFKAAQPECEVVIMTGYSTVKSAVEAIQIGAFDYLEKPFEDISELEEVIERALVRATAKKEVFSEKREQVLRAIGLISGKSEKFQRLLMIAEKLAQKNVTILLRGETGTGKELLARFIHLMSPRSHQPFLAVNCCALPENLMESELFGYQKGAFTGAVTNRKGIFELAHRGTLFLDEIGDASLSVQAKLLRVLETGEIMRLGGEEPIRVDVRVIAATNANLEELVEQKRFREDLFYRLDVVTLTLPPLRERKEDIPLLAEYFLSRHYPPERLPKIRPEVLQALEDYDWPGNIRELANVIAQVAAICDGPAVLKEHLPPKIFGDQGRRPLLNESFVEGDDQRAYPLVSSQEEWFADLLERIRLFVETVDLEKGFNLPQFLENFKQAKFYAARLLIERALKLAKGRYPKAAEILKASPRNLRYLHREKAT